MNAHGSLMSTVDLKVGPRRGYLLEIREPGCDGRRVLVEDLVEVGRRGSGPASDMVTVRHPGVSRRHARLQVFGGELTVTDLGSMNGTLVNGMRIAGTTRLALGDKVSLAAVDIAVVAARTAHQAGTATEAPRVSPVVPPAGKPTGAPARPGYLPAPSTGPAALATAAPAAAPPPATTRARPGPDKAGRDKAGLRTTGPVLLPMPVPRAGADEPGSVTRPFPNYLQLRRRVPAGAWLVAQALAVTGVAALCVLLVARPAVGLQVLWRAILPVLPLLWVVAPGVWRNSCPLAATNQLPRRIGIGRATAPPAWLREAGFVVAVALFLILVPSRKVLFDRSGPASALLLIGAMAGAMAGGLLVRGKGGWCSSVCPLLPVQRLYGQTPFVTVPNSHCRPCVGCAKNCYDFNPRVAYQADLHDGDPRWTAPRKFFVGCFPGVVLGFNLVTPPPAAGPVRFYLAFFAVVLVSAGSFFALDALVRLRVSVLAVSYGAAALCTYYWFSSMVLGGTVHALTGLPVLALAWPLRVVVFGVALVWMGRTFGVLRLFLRSSVEAQPVRLPPAGTARLAADGAAGGGAVGTSATEREVTFQPQGRRVLAADGECLLDLAEKDGLPIEAGCRMGVCGADPVLILSGAAALSAPTDDEKATLRRLDLGEHARLACCTRIHGPVTVSLDARPAAEGRPTEPRAPRRRDLAARRVVIVGNGIAGVTAAQEIRRGDPDCEIHVVGREPHPLYNRMGISRVVYGRSAMAGLFLLAEDWYERRAITCWLNTRAVGVDLPARQVALGTGERLAFDRLILATGARADVPPMEGAATPGCFVLREADDAVRIRAYVQEHRASRAIVVGAGPLAIEGAYALHELGLAVSIVVRGPGLLRRHVDGRCATMLAGYLGARGIALVPGAGVAAVHGGDRVRSATLTDHRRLPADLVLLGVGATPEVQLARSAGIAVRHGILVDERFRTSAAGVYAAGDVAELRGQVTGLWPAAVAHAEVAAANVLGEQRTASAVDTPMLLKGVGIDLVSVGRVHPNPGDTVLTHEDHVRYAYGRVVVESGGRLAGAVLLNLPREAPAILAAARDRTPARSVDALRTPDWR
jgi:nitrite reductase (NADH) large subunit